MRILLKGSFFTDIYGLKLCVQFFIEIFILLKCYTSCIASQLSMFWDNIVVRSSRAKQDNGVKNYHSTLCKVQKITYLTSQLITFLWQSHFFSWWETNTSKLCSHAIVTQDADNKCLTYLERAVASYCVCECLSYHTYCQERSILLGDIKNKAS